MESQFAAPSVSEDSQKQSRNVYVASLPLNFDDQQLQELFSPYGRIVSARIMRAKKSHASKGYGFVMFHQVTCAERAIEGLHGRVVGGSRIQVRRANADASMTFSKTSHAASNQRSVTSTQDNSITSVAQYSVPAASAQHVMYSTALPQPTPCLYAPQPSASPYAIMASGPYQSPNPVPVALNQTYGTIMHPHIVPSTGCGIGTSFIPVAQHHHMAAPIMSQPVPQPQQQPMYVVLLPNGQQVVQPNQFAM
ncbi:RNA-binding protein 5-like protein [Novymonas esmeraldas]|uniref:RNA-binding protein 5-like protein n=1 Tax=Novymonas esmeraldas TaxID=1808958 RepID=A0AAW0ES69_9TRYP